MSRHVEHLVAQADEQAAERRSRGNRLVMILLAVAAVFSTVAMGSLAWVTWQVYSCTSPGWPCYEAAAERTNEVVEHLDQSHQEMERIVRRINAMLAEQEETR